MSINLNIYNYFERVEEYKENNKKVIEEEKQKIIEKYNKKINEIDEIDFINAFYGLIAIKDVVCYKENDKYIFGIHPISAYAINGKIEPCNIIYLCKENEKEEAIEEIQTRIDNDTIYEPNDKYIYLGSFIGNNLHNKRISFNPNNKITENDQIIGEVVDERYEYIVDFMSRVTRFKLNGDYRDKDDLYQLAYVYAQPKERKPKKANKIKRLLLKRD